jgi:hypothetical protein
VKASKGVTTEVNLQLDDRGTFDVLRCPGCGEDHLHHSRTRIFNRDSEDCEKGLVVSVEGAQVVHSSDMRGNPSRRDGIVIDFWCECCFNESSLLISQAKGTTLLWWRTTTDPQAELEERARADVEDLLNPLLPAESTVRLRTRT